MRSRTDKSLLILLSINQPSLWALGGLHSTMDSLCLTVVPYGKRFVAKSTSPALTALGPSPEEATENARLMAIALFATGPRPTMLIARINQPGLCTIIMQPLEKAFTIGSMVEKVGWRYMASVPGPARKVAK